MISIVPTPKATPQPPEQRGSSRHKVDIRLKVIARSGGKNLAIFARASDLSEGGLALFIPADLVVGDTVELEFKLPQSRLPLRIKAAVRRRDNFRYGIEFITLSGAQRDDIKRLCDHLSLLQ